MKPSEISVGATYSNPTAKYGGTRVVDAFVTRLDGTVAVSWTNMVKSNGHAHGVSTLHTFAIWARRKESMSADETAAHKIRALQHAQNEAKYGNQVRDILRATNL